MIKLYYTNSHCAILNITLEVREKLLGLPRTLYIYVYTYIFMYLQIDQPHCKHSNEETTDFNTWNLQLREILFCLKKLLLSTNAHRSAFLCPYFPLLIANPCQRNSPLSQRHGYVLLLLFSLSYSYSPLQHSLVYLFPDLAFCQPCKWCRREVQLRVECLVLTDVYWGLVTNCPSVFWKFPYE